MPSHNGNPDNRGEKAPLSDVELARLLRSDLPPEERAALIERLHGDDAAAEALALAAGDFPESAEGLGPEAVRRILALVREKRATGDMCPHCSGDLHPGGEFCPHCGARAIGSPVTCIRCGKPVREGSSYCPHCGSVFRPPRRKILLESPLFLLVPGLVSIAVAVLYRPLFVLFLALGCVSLGAWAGELWTQRIRVRHVAAQAREQEREEEERRAKIG
jgi:hypothetical protein